MLDNKKYVLSQSKIVKAEENNAVSQVGGFVTPAESGTLTNFREIGQARDRMLSLKLDQVYSSP